ncbi:hypothetical protein Bca4012_008238 [Brassica carinata]|uniref:BnaC05g24300D protein n=2 Tax=Brassica napus TaxID=3708 RepID=A0A078GC24_BRANA|nr:hypothetical protein HID58_057581 [Brassica napus]CAF1712693.1 unnamed protein product [Brassica napus]CDY22592.1 BnaC05g24300D [Brassica napus]
MENLSSSSVRFVYTGILLFRTVTECIESLPLMNVLTLRSTLPHSMHLHSLPRDASATIKRIFQLLCQNIQFWMFSKS